MAQAVGTVRCAERAPKGRKKRRLFSDLDPHVLPPPHFHARYCEFEAIIEIATFKVIEGQLPPRAFNLVQEWATMHREELLKDWRLCRQKASPAQIEPLH
jgi:hypothetical protein